MKFLHKLKELIPAFLFTIIPSIIHFIQNLKPKLKTFLPDFKIVIFKTIGYFKFYITILRGYFISFFIFLRSEEFKKNKFNYFSYFISYCKNHPVKILTQAFMISIFTLCFYFIFSNTKKVIVGTHQIRHPASSETPELINENIIELLNKKYEVALKSASGGHHGASDHHEVEVIFDIKIEALGKESKEVLETMEEKLDDELESFEFSISSLPMSKDELESNEKELVKYLNRSFNHEAHGDVIKDVHLKQSPKKRPDYFLKIYHQYSMKDLTLQIFLEDTTRNHQVNLDFTVLATNHNIVLFLKDNEFKVRDRLSTVIEPVLPHLPIEDEGKTIIKDKIRYELNEMFKEEKVEGRILEVYLEFMLAS